MFPAMFKHREICNSFKITLLFIWSPVAKQNIRQESDEGSQRTWLDLHQWTKSNVNIALIHYLVREHFCQSPVRKILAAFAGSLRVLKAVRTQHFFKSTGSSGLAADFQGNHLGVQTWLNYPHIHPNTDMTSATKKRRKTHHYTCKTNTILRCYLYHIGQK